MTPGPVPLRPWRPVPAPAWAPTSDAMPSVVLVTIVGALARSRRRGALAKEHGLAGRGADVEGPHGLPPRRRPRRARLRAEPSGRDGEPDPCPSLSPRRCEGRAAPCEPMMRQPRRLDASAKSARRPPPIASCIGIGMRTRGVAREGRLPGPGPAWRWRFSFRCRFRKRAVWGTRIARAALRRGQQPATGTLVLVRRLASRRRARVSSALPGAVAGGAAAPRVAEAAGTEPEAAVPEPAGTLGMLQVPRPRRAAPQRTWTTPPRPRGSGPSRAPRPGPQPRRPSSRHPPAPRSAASRRIADRAPADPARSRAASMLSVASVRAATRRPRPRSAIQRRPSASSRRPSETRRSAMSSGHSSSARTSSHGHRSVNRLVVRRSWIQTAGRRLDLLAARRGPDRAPAAARSRPGAGTRRGSAPRARASGPAASRRAWSA